MNFGVHVSFRTILSSGLNPEVELLDHMVILVLAEKVTFDGRLRGGKGVSLTNCGWGGKV